ncbi:MAG: polysaccharide export protein [bacterium]|nr:polysaccharide export protein [bacterium]MDI1337898.1 polysaccharide export protein [Lacunisphaera sp.]
MKTARLALALLVSLLACGLPAVHAESTAIKNEKKNYVHTLALADRLRIAVYQEEDLVTLTRIDARGRINLPLLGEVTIGGMTIVEAQAAIENAYKEGRFLRNPQVTINVEEYAQREVSISGQIRNSGRYSLPPESTYTVVELVTKAGGITDIGKGSAVSVTRTLPDGTRKVFTIDVDSIIKGKKDNKSEDFLLQAGDNVYVPERLI